MPGREIDRGAVLAPSFVPPLLPTLVESPPAGEGWLHEIKHAGYRTQLVIDRRKARAFSRNGHDWTEKYPRVANDAAKIRGRSAVVDGEVIVQDEHGRSDLDALYRVMAEEPHRIVFFAFDLLHLDGKDLCPRPLSERKAMLADLIGDANPFGAVHVSEHFEGDGTTLFAAAERMQLEGIVSKRAGSRYKSGRSSFWQKTKCMTEG